LTLKISVVRLTLNKEGLASTTKHHIYQLPCINKKGKEYDPFPEAFTFCRFFPGTFVFIVFNINGCQQQKQAGPPKKFTITYSTAPNAILMAVALAKDYFTQEGLDVTPQLHASL
jgi:hypothetical protein